ncbi:MAG: thioredoxin [Desulfamplus sp.]|nr:thioredoxin [Desulfamplus sp.]MBF0210586.1 thioredoxin [Desulfamplus sp.]MBF0241392.1 thioredoxin [Desulfamplus sp.]MBF0389131.1 thioredoxin [Desulfamplus sp.]
MSGNIIEIDDDAFEATVIKSDIPVLVDFWAPWCGPCRAIAPTIEELEKQYSGKIKFVKLNVDENPQSPTKYAIQAIPTLIFYKGGKVVEQITGMVAKSKLEETLDSLL